MGFNGPSSVSVGCYGFVLICVMCRFGFSVAFGERDKSIVSRGVVTVAVLYMTLPNELKFSFYKPKTKRDFEC